ncbi:MAG TPA: S-methyl-5'-thioadenosine phosphorylase [Acidimicrobiales bacterium]|nr:S-methyl-5'-thioadenosine phosphorylase [Acidimicrobiales bacterium]
MIGVFGGSGFYELLDHAEEHRIDTPWGAPSDVVTVGRLGDADVAFLPRHGRKHHLPPAKVRYRANLWALRELGVTRVFGPCAVGSLQRHIEPGHVVVCDQLVDRTWGRADTYFADGPEVVHVSFADPYCPELRAVAIGAARTVGATVHDTGTVVVIPGPRFSTRAESRTYRELGYDVINMTQHPEAYLARELGICYSTLALVTDHDSGVDGIEPVTMAEVLRVFDANIARLREILGHAVVAVPTERACSCADATGGKVPTPPPANP